jgi:hypothetical protein
MRSLLATATSTAICVAFVVGCSGSDGADVADTVATPPTAADSAPPNAEPSATEPPATDAPATEPPATDPPATEPPATDPPATDAPATEPTDAEPAGVDPFVVVEELAADELDGRNNLTDGSATARELLLAQLVGVVEPARPDADGDEGYLQTYDLGTNIVGILPGRGDLADQYVMIGAHYDHLGPGECDTRGVTDDAVCNGAADNAAGVGVVLSIVTAIHDADAPGSPGASDGAPRRSVIVGLWDGEEDGLVGSEAYVADPLVPLDRTVAYVNFDIQGAQLSPALADTTVVVGPETGGAVLVDAARRATDASALDYATFSIVFGQGRSDHATLAAAGVPSVFFTDANNGCYHTVSDDVAHVDREKLTLQAATAQALVDDLVTMPTPPTHVADAPLSTFDDAATLLDLVARAEPDFGRLPGDGPATTARFLVDLQAIVDAGPDAYDDAATGVVLGGAATLVNALAESECVLPQ